MASPPSGNLKCSPNPFAPCPQAKLENAPLPTLYNERYRSNKTIYFKKMSNPKMQKCVYHVEVDITILIVDYIYPF